MPLRDRQAARRIKTLLELPNTDIGSITDLLTDIIHYCNLEGEDFNSILKDAKDYVWKDIETDEAEFDDIAELEWNKK
jgi:hypothetical protein